MIRRLNGGYKKEFVRFLLRYKCYNEYVYAISKSRWTANIIDAKNYILSAFDWAVYDFLLPESIKWEDVYDEWFTELSRIREKYISKKIFMKK